MSRQTSLVDFFQVKSKVSLNAMKSSDRHTENNRKICNKRCSRSPDKHVSPTKSAKKENENLLPLSANEDSIVIISSDEENNSAPEPVVGTPSPIVLQQSSENVLEPESSKSVIHELPPKTPQKPITSSSRSWGSRHKFYSPTKKRTVDKIIPVKRNLNRQLLDTSQSSVDDDSSSPGYEDNEIISLLSIINKCFKEESLKCLLDPNSQEILARCMLLPKPVIELVRRLYWRQHTWYTYKKIADIITNMTKAVDDTTVHGMLSSLVADGLLIQSAMDDGTNACTFEDLTKILKFDELKKICKDLKLKTKSKKDGIQALSIYSQRRGIYQNFSKSNNLDNSSRVLMIMRSKAGPCYKLSDLAQRAIYKLYLLMYLGVPYNIIREKKLELMLNNDKINRETYPVDKSLKVDNASVVFRSQDEFDKYLEAHYINENFLTCTNPRERSVIVLEVLELYKQIDDSDMTRYKSYPVWLHRYTPPYVYVKILESGVRDLKRVRNFQAAVDVLSLLITQGVFRQDKIGIWYAEKAFLLHRHLRLHNEAAKLLFEAFNADLSSDAQDYIRPRALLIAKHQNTALAKDLRDVLNWLASEDQKLEKDLDGEHIYKQPMEKYGKGKKITFEVREHDNRIFLDAEQYCLWHYKNEGTFTDGGHWEGKIVITIFFLLFWDIIYTKPRGVTGIFLSHYQQYPLDMHSDSFYTNRKELIDDRLAEIRTSTEERLMEMLRSRWEERPEHEVSGVWRGAGWGAVGGAARALGAGGAAAVCARLAARYGHARAGFPDLTLWNTHTNTLKFVEVKTDSDKPSLKQIQWMHYLREHDIDTGFCYVGVNTTRCKSRAGLSNPQPPQDDSDDQFS